MVLLQPKLNLRVSQKQILTPGLVQMVSVLALNKIELKDMITAEMMENPVLEELETGVPLLDDIAGKEADRDRAAAAEPEQPATVGEKEDPFEQIDFGSFFKDYLDPGYRSPESESIEKPSFENFVSKPATLTEHLMWQLGSIHVTPEVYRAAELVIGNLNEDGYLTATDDELMAVARGEYITTAEPPVTPDPAAEIAVFAASAEPVEPEAAGLTAELGADSELNSSAPPHAETHTSSQAEAPVLSHAEVPVLSHAEAPVLSAVEGLAFSASAPASAGVAIAAAAEPAPVPSAVEAPTAKTTAPPATTAKIFTIPKRADSPDEAGEAKPQAPFELEDLREAIELVRQMDPIGVAARDLRECLLLQLEYLAANGNGNGKSNGKRNGNGTAAALGTSASTALGTSASTALGTGASTAPSTSAAQTNGHAANGHIEDEQVIHDAVAIVDAHLKQVQTKQFKEIARALARPLEAVNRAMELVRSLDPRPGLRYNKIEPRLIEPDVAFVKHGDEFVVVMNDEDVPQLRLSPTYRRLLQRDAADKDVRGYVKERYKAAIQLIKNIEQRKQTILKVCYAILGRQRDFLDKGIDQLKPMMIKEVAEEIGVHPSTVSRAVANKYAHTPQGVFELRYFFSESVNGPEGGNTSLLILKRRVKKLIEEEDSAHPYTDEQITRILQSQGIQVTRRTVAKYREDMGIPSTHQRRVKA